MPSAGQPSVGVVIPCFNQVRFLSGAIESAIAQTVSPKEIIVVDDGSTEDIRPVARAYSQVSLIRQHNKGLAAARNTGLEASTSEKLIFLDADDRLLPEAIATGLECFRAHPQAGFVYGAHRLVRGADVSAIYHPVSSHRDFIRCNWVGMVATAMFDRSKLQEIGGFDESLGMCEDWDSYLRLSRRYPFFSHDDVVADYIRHRANASNDLHRLWKWIDVVRARERDRGLDAEDQIAWREGESIWSRLLGPDPGEPHLLGRGARKAGRLVRRLFR